MSEQAKYPPAGPARDRLIAEKLGWTQIDVRTYWRDDGEGAYLATGLEGHAPYAAFGVNAIARYSTDANAALPLLKDIPEGYVLWDAEKKVYRAGGFVDGPGLTPEGESADPADAITTAWLVWQDGK